MTQCTSFEMFFFLYSCIFKVGFVSGKEEKKAAEMDFG